jgi:hypothetical protein
LPPKVRLMLCRLTNATGRDAFLKHDGMSYWAGHD